MINALESGRTSASYEAMESYLSYFVRPSSGSLPRSRQILTSIEISIHGIFRNRLRIFPYSIQVIQQLEDIDYITHTLFATSAFKI